MGCLAQAPFFEREKKWDTAVTYPVIMTYSAPPGVFDILPEDPKDPWKSSYLWNFVEKEMRKIAHQYGFSEIRTPLLEKTELLTRGVGETSDIVTKEMYTFEDKGGRNLTLRPEGTAPVIRAFLENRLEQQGGIHKLYYIAPMFRYERSQAGRYRQHHQFGVEVIGSSAPEIDAEMIEMTFSLYTLLGIRDLSVNINSLGTPLARQNYREALKKYLASHLNRLSADSKNRFEKNPLRILDSKDKTDQEIVANAPNILEFLDDESKEHFEKVKTCLNLMQVPYKINPLLVRGLDYYNKTVFEIVTGSLGAQNSIGGGGRYDGLISLLGGPNLPSVGFGTGIERILQTMLNQNVSLPKKPASDLFLIPLGEKAKEYALTLQKELRDAGVAVETDYSGKKLGKIMGQLSSLGIPFVGILGDDEIARGEISLKEMSSGSNFSLPITSLKRVLKIATRTDDFIDLWKEMTTPFSSESESSFFLAKLQKSIDQNALASKQLIKAFQEINTIIE